MFGGPTEAALMIIAFILGDLYPHRCAHMHGSHLEDQLPKSVSQLSKGLWFLVPAHHLLLYSGRPSPSKQPTQGFQVCNL